MVLKGGLVREPEFWLNPPGFTMFNTSGVECEVGELLWALVRVMKPDWVLETGTSYGVSAAYLSAGLRDNGHGRLVTLDATPAYQEKARGLCGLLGTLGRIEFVVSDSRDYDPGEQAFDILFLDTEPPYRWGELVRFWKNLRPGGLAILHDLHPHMNQNGQFMQPTAEHPRGMRDPPWGTIPDAVRGLVEGGDLQSLHLTTPRGLYLGQKSSPAFYTTSVLKRQPWVPWFHTEKDWPHR
jgi:predicted O-methyltransferase YrrM